MQQTILETQRSAKGPMATQILKLALVFLCRPYFDMGSLIFDDPVFFVLEKLKKMMIIFIS